MPSAVAKAGQIRTARKFSGFASRYGVRSYVLLRTCSCRFGIGHALGPNKRLPSVGTSEHVCDSLANMLLATLSSATKKRNIPSQRLLPRSSKVPQRPASSVRLTKPGRGVFELFSYQLVSLEAEAGPTAISPIATRFAVG